MCRNKLTSLLIATLSLTLHTPCNSTPAPTLSAAEKWSFTGDSITHRGSYYAWIYLYYATRFPQHELNIINNGISGDTSWGALARYDWDIATGKPTTATIMLGMNDVGRNLYGQDATEAIFSEREKRIQMYQHSMRELVRRFKEDGVRVILVTPSPYDDTAQLPGTNLHGVNAALGRLGEIAQQIGNEEDVAVIDLHGKMTRLNGQLQSGKPDFTLIGTDRIHPQTSGHLVMSYFLLDALNAPMLVSGVQIDAQTLNAETQRAELSGLTKSPDGAIHFTCLQEALPFPVAGEYEAALEYVPFIERFNQETLSFSHLPTGTYELSIDGVSIGTFDAQALADGINLATIPQTPQYRQALEVLDLVKRWRTAFSDLRGIAFVEHSHLKGALRPIRLENVEPKLQETLQRLRTTGAHAPSAASHARYIESYLSDKPEEARIQADIRELELRIRESARPKPHDYTLRPV